MIVPELALRALPAFAFLFVARPSFAAGICGAAGVRDAAGRIER